MKKHVILRKNEKSLGVFVMEFIGPDCSLQFLRDEHAAWCEASERLAKMEIILSTLAGNHHPATDNERKAMVCWHNATAILREIDRREKLSALPEMIVEEIDEIEDNQPLKLKRAKKIEVEEPTTVKRQKVKNGKNGKNANATKKRKIVN